jgi:hypothetical protein
MTRPRRPSRASIGPDESIVKTDDLERMARKERAHDDYREVMRWMNGRRDAMAGYERDGHAIFAARPDYWHGWMDCVFEMDGAIVRQARGEKL